MALTTTAAVKRTLRTESTDTARDADIELAIDAVEQAIRVFCGRTFDVASSSVAVRKFPYPRHPDGSLLIHDTWQTSTITISGNGYDWLYGVEFDSGSSRAPVPGVVVYSLEPLGRNRWPDVTDTDGLVAVSAKWGFESVPPAVRQAATIWAQRLFSRMDSKFGAQGMVSGGEDGLHYLRTTDPDVEALLMPFCGPRRLVA